MGQTFRRLAICYHRVHESVARGACRFGKIETELNLADLFSKVLPEPSRHRLLNGIIWRESYGLREVEKNGMKKMVHLLLHTTQPEEISYGHGNGTWICNRHLCTIPFAKVEGMEVFGLELRRDEVAHVVLPREKPVPAKKAHEILGHVGNDATRKTMNYWGWKC